MKTMYRLFVLSLLLICHATTQAQKTQLGRVDQCISGDCMNGTGEAIVILNGGHDGDKVHYTGTFKKGLMDGEGTLYTVSTWVTYGDNKDHTEWYTGNFEKNERMGYGSSWRVKRIGGQVLPDSSKDVAFVKYDGDNKFKSILVMSNGTTENNWAYGDMKTHDWHKNVKDDWINEQVKNFLTARAGSLSSGPSSHPVILAVRSLNLSRDNWSVAINWDCLTDRKYYINAEYQTKYHQPPFGGSLTMQVIASDNTVAFEGPVDYYWTPRTAGKYTFQLKFSQGKIVGTGAADNYVSGVQVIWTLKSQGLQE